MDIRGKAYRILLPGNLQIRAVQAQLVTSATPVKADNAKYAAMKYLYSE